MRKLFSVVRADERRATLGAFLTLLALMCGHALLETARDALFLAKVPASELPWVYLGIAAISLTITQLQERFRGAESWRRVVIRWLLLAATVTLGFWFLVPSGGAWVLYALYIWSGVLATLVLVRFWTLLADLFTTTQAKRLFAVVGVGSALGAIVGSGVAGLVATFIEARHLVLVASVVLGASALIPLLLLPEPEPSAERSREPGRRDRTLLDVLAVVAAKPYTRRLALLVLVSTVALTFADYLFKSVAADAVDAADLGTFFAGVYFVLNIVSLLLQLFLVGWLLRRLSITLSLALLPAVLLFGAAGMVAVGTLAAALVLKGADGSLRYSLHRTVSELLYVPMSERMRGLVKGVIDVVGQRGGQALASVLILGMVGVGAGIAVLAAVLCGLLGLWLVLAVELRPHYLNLFRGTLEQDLIQVRLDFPELDMGSLESMIAALNSDNDAEVIGALDMLASEERVRLIPVLILYHPSDSVVIRALDLFAQDTREDYVKVAKRIFEQREPEVQAAIVRAVSTVAGQQEFLRHALELDCHIVRATTNVTMIARGELTGDAGDAALERLLDNGFVPALVAAARTVENLRSDPIPAALVDTMVTLSRSEALEVRHAVAEAMAKRPNEAYLAGLVHMLSEPELREAARLALLAHGEPALDFLESSLRKNLYLSYRIRRHLPRTISRFAGARPAAILLDHLTSEEDGMVRFKILRGLGQMRLANPTLGLDPAALDAALHDAIAQVYHLLDWRLSLVRETTTAPERATQVQDMLVQMLSDKQVNATDRLFRVLALKFPARDIGQIKRGLASRHKATRSSSIELLEGLLSQPLRGPVTALVDDLEDSERLALADPYYVPQRLSYESVLRQLLESSSESLRSLAVYHIGELGLSELKPDLEEISTRESSYLGKIVDRVLQALTAPTGQSLAYES